VSPIAGTVVDVQLAAGDQVGAASSTARVRIAGDGGVEATTTVSVDHLADVAVGQRAVVVPDGSDEHLPASVVSVGTVPVSTGSTSYRVVLALADPEARGLGDGATATATITTAATASALAVPTSAVATTGTRHTLTVLDGDTPRTVQVGVGAVGATWTQITSGLDAGERVVLADLDAALPGSATASSSTTGAGSFAERAALRAAGVGGPPGGFGGRVATGGR
jgi:hypothetical protein